LKIPDERKKPDEKGTSILKEAIQNNVDNLRAGILAAGEAQTRSGL
jgi:hypothetical protein